MWHNYKSYGNLGLARTYICRLQLVLKKEKEHKLGHKYIHLRWAFIGKSTQPFYKLTD